MRCWVEEFASLADLAQEAPELAKHRTKFAYKYVEQAERRRQRFLEEELADMVPRAGAVTVDGDSS